MSDRSMRAGDISQSVVVTGDGNTVALTFGAYGISLPLLEGLNGEPKKWREAAPFIWREVEGKDWLAAKVEGGRVAMFTGDEISPFMVFLPTPWWRASVWLLPLLGLSLAALVLTLLLWPTAALVRRHYRVAFALEGRQASAHRLIRVAVALTLLALAGWFWPERFATTAEVDLRVGGRYRIDGPGAGMAVAGTYTAVDPPRRLVQSFRALWSDAIKAEGTSRITWEIERIGDSCRLTLIHDQLREKANTELYGGHPMVLSGLKTLLETGELLTTPASLRFLKPQRAG